jgi:hypothetical protein
VRLGVLGPAQGDLVALAKAAQHLLDVARAERVIYLGADDALDKVVLAWAQELVGGNPAENILFSRAAHACVNADPEAIGEFVEKERARRRLRVFTTVPPPPGRTAEILDGKVAVVLYDKATLDEEDIAGASYLVFGKSKASVVHRVGTRTFLSPGPIGEPSSGAMVLDDEVDGLRIDIIDATGTVVRTERLDARKPSGTGKMRVQE